MRKTNNYAHARASLTRQRWLGAASGIFVALLGLAPLSFMAYVTVLMFLRHDFKIWPYVAIGFVMFGYLVGVFAVFAK